MKDDNKNKAGLKEQLGPELKILNIRGEMYHTRLTKKFENKRKWQKTNEKHLISFIPGTVCSVFVKPGDAVGTQSKLMVLEAMKMQNIIYSPIEGMIKSVHVREGEKIPKGVVMIEFE
ncbi:MAG: acetyl-CoA carboxylase biotin carboxyl carrier protein subunit [Bacteroidales bacterium]|nr:acetyl-CoA carboxylase biotin carboxyl carrier protein subunit [Bacteroidales bacterium]